MATAKATNVKETEAKATKPAKTSKKKTAAPKAVKEKAVKPKVAKKAKAKPKKKPKKRTKKDILNNIHDINNLIEALTITAQDKRLELAKVDAHKKAAHVWGAKLAKIQTLFNIFLSAHARVELAVSLLQKSADQEPDAAFDAAVLEILLASMVDKMRIMPFDKRKDYVTQQLWRVYSQSDVFVDVANLTPEQLVSKKAIDQHVEQLIAKANENTNTLLFSTRD
jgi:hypothetical protein